MYKRALVAIDRDERSSHQVLKKAAQRATELFVLHVLEPQEIQYSVDPTFRGRLTRQLELQAKESALHRVQSLCEESGVVVHRTDLEVGHAASTIRKAALDHQCDVIVIGSHGRRGWQRILGSTANAVIHGAPVDVLAHKIE